MRPIDIAKLCHLAIDLASDAMYSDQWRSDIQPVGAASLAVALSGPGGCSISAQEMREAGMDIADIDAHLDITELVAVAAMMLYVTQTGATAEVK